MKGENPAERTGIGDTARVLKMWREVAELNQKELADLAGIHYTTISAYETGTATPQAETVARVTAALGMTAVDREMGESYVAQLLHTLRGTRVEGGDPPVLAPTSKGVTLARRQEITQTILDGSRFLTRFLLLLFDILIGIAEAGSTSGRKAGNAPAGDTW